MNDDPDPLRSKHLRSERDARKARARDPASEAQTMEKLAAVLASSPSAALQALLDASLELCGAHSAAVGLRESDSDLGQPIWQLFAGELKGAEGPRLATPSAACTTVMHYRTVQRVSDPPAKYAEFAKLGRDVVNALAAPVVSEGVPVGALWVFLHNNETNFDCEDARALAQLAILAAIAQRLQAHTRLAEHTRYLHERRLALLWHSAEILLAADNPDTMLRELFKQIREDLQIDTYFNFMVVDGGESLALASFTGISKETAERIKRLEYGQAVCGTVAVQRVSIIASHIQDSSDPKVQLVKGYGIRAYACNPLMSGDRLLGTLSFATRTRDSFNAEDLDFFRMISRYVAVAYERLNLIESLREADRRKDEFLAMLAHELRNPLAPIRASVEFLKRKAPDPDLQSAHGIIERQVTNMVRLVDDLLDVARVTQGRIELQCTQVTLRMILDQSIEAVRPAIEGAAHELRVDLPNDPILLNVDPTRLAQVFANLLDNAAKYTPRGGWIEVRARREIDQLFVSVSDNGTGIPKDMLPRVFDLFTQVDRTRQRSRGGLGIGLTLVRKLVELHGGSVKVSSAGENKGSEFQVTLPLAKTQHLASTDSTHLQHSEGAATASERILIVDDNRDAADSLAALLRCEGHSVLVGYDGTQALALIQQHRPSVMFLDIGMPGMDGHEVCHRIRSQSAATQIKIIALTGYGQTADRERTYESGFDGHLVKPVNLEALMGALTPGPL